ncbi:unnamed protein product [Penicillium salamii]|uniref:Uncharacterized protein n=1 Tax=Penicillium salamii TaxID=1612424 RepID=A0A9W4JSQ5_9EURO|nr:unnamed protein product [Penicillium salamii]CAG8381092.1 unnamed protein product [Penicillium salamii]CAG8412291.1 unnamed protein product [Penicillium salamii]CAG8412781.1 unnamed protein product [Penicillium salamii]
MARTLPPEYEIRVLGPEHEEWARSICLYTNIFYSPLWPVVYPENKTQRLYQSFHAAHYLIKHQIDSGYSLGIFHKNYEFKRPESATTGGKLYWDFDCESATPSELEEQMDFPLVSIAMAYDGINELDMNQLMPLLGAMPLFATLVKAIGDLDPRDPVSWKPTGPRQLLMRNATNTMKAHSGRGLMRLLAEEMMRRSVAEGFRGIQIETAHDAVWKVWSNPPAPFRGTTVCQFHTMEYVEKGESQAVYPFRPADLPITRIYVDLRADQLGC